MRHTFESGEWIEAMPLAGLRAKHKDAADAAMKLYVSFDKDGNPDMTNVPFSMSIAKMRRNVVMAMCLSGWSFTSCQLDDEGEPVPGTEYPLPVPSWAEDGAQGIITNEESFGELRIDDMLDLEAFFAPYTEKLQRKPDPKGTITSTSSSTSRADGADRQKG